MNISELLSGSASVEALEAALEQARQEAPGVAAALQAARVTRDTALISGTGVDAAERALADATRAADRVSALVSRLSDALAAARARDEASKLDALVQEAAQLAGEADAAKQSYLSLADAMIPHLATMSKASQRLREIQRKFAGTGRSVPDGNWQAIANGAQLPAGNFLFTAGGFRLLWGSNTKREAA